LEHRISPGKALIGITLSISKEGFPLLETFFPAFFPPFFPISILLNFQTSFPKPPFKNFPSKFLNLKKLINLFITFL